MSTVRVHLGDTIEVFDGTVSVLTLTPDRNTGGGHLLRVKSSFSRDVEAEGDVFVDVGPRHVGGCMCWDCL